MTIDRKVQYGSTVTAVTGLATWLLTTYAFHGSMPTAVATALPVLIASVIGWITSYMTKQAPKDVVRAADKLESDATVHQMSLALLATHTPNKVQARAFPKAYPPVGPQAPFGGQ